MSSAASSLVSVFITRYVGLYQVWDSQRKMEGKYSSFKCDLKRKHMTMVLKNAKATQSHVKSNLTLMLCKLTGMWP